MIAVSKRGSLTLMSIQEEVLPDVRTVALVGTGLLGTSIGLALKRLGFGGWVVGIGRTERTLQQASATGALDQTTSDLADAAEADLIILCTPVDTIRQQIEALAGILPEGGCAERCPVMTDVGSTKQSICATAEKLLQGKARFVGSHPMAGSDMAGPGNSSANLFAGKPAIVTPTDATDPAATELVTELWRMLGMRVMTLPPAEHDQQVARVSHLPHLIASVLVEQAAKADGLKVASTGFAGTTRIASGLPGLWAEIFRDNREALFAAIDEHLAEIAILREKLEAGDHEGVEAYLRPAKQRRDHWRLGASEGESE